MLKAIHFAVVLPLTLSAAIPALAIQADDRTPAAIRQEIRLSNVRIEGSLTCKMAMENNGQPCAISLQEGTSGRVYGFANPGEALRLFNSGARFVAVEGTMAGETTIQIKKIAAL
jgi:hypothetical protein